MREFEGKVAVITGGASGLGRAMADACSAAKMRIVLADVEDRALAKAESHDVFRNLAFAMIQHSLGHPAESDAALKALIDGFGWTAAYQIAEAYAHRGEIDKAYEWLETAYSQRDPGVVYTAVDGFLMPLHGDPRWQPFLKRMSLA